MRLSDRLQGLCAQSWAKTGLGKKPYNARKYGTRNSLTFADTTAYHTPKF